MSPTVTHIHRLLFLITSSWLLASCEQDPSAEQQIENTLELMNLPANQWIKYHHESGDWWRKGHAGLAYDSKRGSLIIFGSDTHGEDWDNSIHEFSPKQRRWIHHSPDAPKDSYRTDTDGNPISGSKQLQPWAMHTYDGVTYDPGTDSILITAEPDHNPIGIKRSKAPVWRYQLAERKWHMITVDSASKPRFFGASAAYDAARNSLMICSHGLWSLSSDNDSLRKVASSPQCLHSTMAYDKHSNDLYLFGQYKPSNAVWKLQRDPINDQPVSWQKLTPSGDCPLYTSTPVAFEPQAGVFVLVVNNKAQDSDKASTFIYDPLKNHYLKLTDSTLPRLAMNFMMAWDEVHKVMFLVTGSWKEGITVWAMRLDLSRIQ